MADTKFDKEILKFSIKGTNELEKVKEMLKEAEKRRKKLIENINNLKELQKDLNIELDETEAEIDQLKSIAYTLREIQSKKNKKRTDGKDGNRLFVGGLLLYSTERDLEKYFQKYGKVIAAQVIKFPLSSQSRGFGFVEYETDEMAQVALKNAPHFVAGKKVEIKLAWSKQSSGARRRRRSSSSTSDYSRQSSDDRKRSLRH